MKKHLKVQLEVFFSSIHLKIAGNFEESKEPDIYQRSELALESLVDFCREPSLVLELYTNYDCDDTGGSSHTTARQHRRRSTSSSSGNNNYVRVDYCFVFLFFEVCLFCAFVCCVFYVSMYMYECLCMYLYLWICIY